MEDFLKERKQGVVLNRQDFRWEISIPEYPKVSFLVHSCFWFILDILWKASLHMQSYDTSLFPVVHDTQTSANDVKKDLDIINNGAFEWKMNFNPGPTRQA